MQTVDVYGVNNAKQVGEMLNAELFRRTWKSVNWICNCECSHVKYGVRSGGQWLVGVEVCVEYVRKYEV